MRSLLLATAFFVSSIVVAQAGDIMASRYGNTTITTDANGNSTHLYYKADGTFTGKQGDAAFKGTWKMDGANVCLTADTPIPNTPNPACAPASAHAVGDNWQAGPYKVSLVKGIQ